MIKITRRKILINFVLFFYSLISEFLSIGKIEENLKKEYFNLEKVEELEMNKHYDK